MMMDGGDGCDNDIRREREVMYGYSVEPRGEHIPEPDIQKARKAAQRIISETFFIEGYYFEL